MTKTYMIQNLVSDTVRSCSSLADALSEAENQAAITDDAIAVLVWYSDGQMINRAEVHAIIYRGMEFHPRSEAKE